MTGGSAPDDGLLRTVEVRVLVWNIGGGRAGTGSGHTPAVVEVLRRWRADINLLQEVNQDQVEPIRSALRARAAFGPDQRGDAIISRWAFLASRSYRFRGKPVRNPMPREGPLLSFMYGRIAHPARPIHVFSVHYPLPGDTPDRINSSRRQWTCSAINGVLYRKELREALLNIARQREAVIVGGDFNGHTVNLDCAVRPPRDDGCHPFFPIPHCENVNVAEAARLRDEWWPSIDGAAFSTPEGRLPGFLGETHFADEPSARIAEHAPVIYELSGPTPPERAGCADARARVRAIPSQIARQRERMRGLTPRDPDYREIKEDVDRNVRALQAEAARRRTWAAQHGCDVL